MVQYVVYITATCHNYDSLGTRVQRQMVHEKQTQTESRPTKSSCHINLRLNLFIYNILHILSMFTRMYYTYELLSF